MHFLKKKHSTQNVHSINQRLFMFSKFKDVPTAQRDVNGLVSQVQKNHNFENTSCAGEIHNSHFKYHEYCAWCKFFACMDRTQMPKFGDKGL